MGSGASSATPCLAGFFALRCFSLITIWVTPESWAVKLITSLPHWFYTRILRVPKCFPAVGPSLDANSLHNSGGILLEGGAMVPRILHLHPKTYKRLIRLRKQAERDGAYRVAKRLQAVVLNSEGRTSGEL